MQLNQIVVLHGFYNHTMLLAGQICRMNHTLPARHAVKGRPKGVFAEVRFSAKDLSPRYCTRLLGRNFLPVWIHYDQHGGHIIFHILSLCRREGFEPNVVYTDSHMRNICSMVASGMGISLLNEHLISENVPGICAVPVIPEFLSQISLCYSSEFEPSKQQKEFLGFYKKEMKKAAEGCGR